MTRFIFLCLTLFAIFLPGLLYSQHTADSLQGLLKDADLKRSGTLHLELANFFLAQAPDSTLHHARIAREIATQNGNPIAVIRSYAMTAEAYQKQNKMK